MAKKRLKPIPRFHSEPEEREFWATHDTTDYVDWSKAQRHLVRIFARPPRVSRSVAGSAPG